jgi:biopolymer transport protein ExbB
MTLSAIEIIGNALFVVMAVGGVMLSLIPRRREREMLHLLKRSAQAVAQYRASRRTAIGQPPVGDLMRRSTGRAGVLRILAVIVTLVITQLSGVAASLAQEPAPSAPAASGADSPPPASGSTPAAVATESVAPPSPGQARDKPASEPARAPSTDRRVDLPHDLSPRGMFMAADWVVKVVMIGLAFASLMTWTVWLAKSVEIACARARAKRAFEVITSSESLAAADHVLANRGGPAAFMVRSAREEIRQSSAALDYAGDGGVKERVVSRLARIEAQAGRRLTRGTGLLATTGATAPFVGLFGTVWGIMNSFIGISQAQTTNLAVVAPGIAEALLATAIGLVAAIPAVVIYNAFARAITGYRHLLADAAAGVERLISRDLDFRKIPANVRAATAVLAAE